MSTDSKFQPFRIGHVPYRVRRIMRFIADFYRWLQKRESDMNRYVDYFPIMIWENRETEGTFDFVFPGRIRAHVVMTCHTEHSQVIWNVQSVTWTKKGQDGSIVKEETWQGDDLAALIASFPT